VNDATCPSCKEAVGEVVERERLNGGVKVSFECEGCGYQWEVVF